MGDEGQVQNQQGQEGQPPAGDQGQGEGSETQPTSEEVWAAVQKKEAERQAAQDAQNQQGQQGQGEGTPPAPGDPAYDQVALAHAKTEEALRKATDQLKEQGDLLKQNEELMRRLKDPSERYKVVEEFGGSYEEHSELAIKGDQPPKSPLELRLDRLEQENQALKKHIETGDQKTKEQQAQERQQQIEAAAVNFVNENAAELPMIKALNRSQLVLMDFQQKVADGVDPGQLNLLDIAKAAEARLAEGIGKELKALQEASPETLSRLLQSSGITPNNAGTQANNGNGQANQAARQANQQGNNQPASGTTLTNQLSAESGEKLDLESLPFDSEELQEHALRIADKRDQANSS